MAAQGYIGRAPGESSVVVARQTFTPTGITTNFTFASGYEVGYVDAYLNGVRLIEGDDYTATDGSVVGLTTHAINGDVLELVVYKAFNLANVTGANGDFSVPDKIIHANDTDTAIRFPQADTFTVETAGSEVIRIDANGNVGIGTTNTLRIADPKNQSGINVGFITANSITAAAGSFGSLNVSGTLTYEDVANQDVVGFSTFRKGINVQGAGSTTTTLNVTGVTTMTGDVNIAAAFNIPDAITHVGDTNTKIRFPAADTFTVETGGSERLRIDSSGRLLVGTTSSRSVGDEVKLQIEGTDQPTSTLSATRNSANAAGPSLNFGKSRGSSVGSNTVVQDDDLLGNLNFFGADGTDTNTKSASIQAFVDGTPGSNDMPGRLVFSTTADGASTPTERLRITSGGNVIHSGVDGRRYSFASDGSAHYTKFDSTLNGIILNGYGGIIFETNGTNERLRIDSSGRVLLGHTANINNHLQQITTSNGAALSLLNYQATDDGPEVTFIKSRNGTKGSHTVVNNGDFLGRIFFRGSDGDSYERGVEIAAQVDGTPGDGDMPGRLIISTTADGASTPTERLRITSGGLVRVPDNGKFTAGAGDDLQIYHDGSDNYIKAGGNLEIWSTNVNLRNTDGSEYFLRAFNNGEVQLFHNNSEKFRTKSDGVDITGELQCDSLDVDGTSHFFDDLTFQGASYGARWDKSENQLEIDDNAKIVFGNSADLKIYHNGSVNYLAGNETRMVNSAVTETMAKFIADGAVELYHNNVKRLETSATGVSVTGDMTASGNVTAYSDITLKENIETIPNALDKVLNLRGVEFDRIDKEDNPHEIGVIAQEVEEVIPEVVLEDKHGIKSVAYGNLVGLLIESIKELKAEVNDLKAQVEG